MISRQLRVVLLGGGSPFGALIVIVLNSACAYYLGKILPQLLGALGVGK